MGLLSLRFVIYIRTYPHDIATANETPSVTRLQLWCYRLSDAVQAIHISLIVSQHVFETLEKEQGGRIT